MTEQSKKIMADFQMRKSGKQKERFRQWLCGELEKAGYAPVVERSAVARNVVAGDPEKADFLMTAHYDTCAVLPFPNIVTPRNLPVFILYQALICAAIFAIAFAAAAAVSLIPGVTLRTQSRVWGGMALLCCWWMLFGKANRHTANDNTSGVLTLVETALALPPEQRDRVCFVFFDNEERGMFGSAAFAKRHKTVKRDKLVLNCDCVSDGDYIQFFPSGGLKKDPAAMERLERVFQGRGAKQVELVRGGGFYPSDNGSFRKGVGICALRKGPVGYYMSRIHTAGDTVLEEENIRLLRDGFLRLAEETAPGRA